jgi:phosphatidyl-myo-inositol dimannoside synthase
MARSGSAARPGVILVTELFPPDVGGTPSLFSNIYSRLGPTAVTVLTNNGRAASSDGNSQQVRIERMAMAGADWGLTSPRSLGRYWRVAARMRSEWRRRPAVFHCARALPEGFAAYCATRLCRSAQYVCWTHGEELHYAKSSRQLTMLLTRVHRGAAALIANSRNTARELEALGVPPEKIRIVYPGVHVESFGDRRAGYAIRRQYAADNELLLLTVGRLQRRKGHDVAIEALAQMRCTMPHLKYVIVGDGDERGRLEALVESRGLRDRVTFAGAVSAELLPAYYAAADIFLHPNRVDQGEVEGFGIVFLEAAAAGLPVIGGNTGGVPEAIEEGVTGLLVSGTDVGEVAAAVRTLGANPAIRTQMGEAGRARVCGHFTWERAAEEVTALQDALWTNGPTR